LVKPAHFVAPVKPFKSLTRNKKLFRSPRALHNYVSCAVIIHFALRKAKARRREAGLKDFLVKKYFWSGE